MNYSALARKSQWDMPHSVDTLASPVIWHVSLTINDDVDGRGWIEDFARTICDQNKTRIAHAHTD